MSLLSSFIRNNLIKAIEAELVEAAPHLQEIAIQELRAFADEIIQWTESKLQLDLNHDSKIGS